MAFLPRPAFPPLPSLAPVLTALGLLGLGCPVGASGAGAALASPAATFQANVRPLLKQYCYECHGNGKHKGDVALDRDQDVGAVHDHSKIWETVMERVHAEEMPPDDADLQPSQAERDAISGWIEHELFHLDPNNPDPGAVTIHRLNRAEYNNTVRDLVGVDFQPANDFPADNSGYGFDNISDVLSLSPVLLEKYLTAAQNVLDQAIPTELVKSRTVHLAANLMAVGFNADGDRGDGWMPLGSLEEDGVSTTTNFSAGDYNVGVLAFATPKGKYASSNKPLSQVPVVLTCMLDDTIVGTWKIDVPEASARVFTMRIGIPAGKHRLAFVNHHLRGGKNELILKNGRPGPLQGGTIWVKSVDLEGPLATATHRFTADQLAATGEGASLSGGSRVLPHNGEVALTYAVPAAGEYFVRVQASAHQAGPQPVQMELRLDGQPVHTFAVIAPAKLAVPPGQRVFSMVLLNAVPQVYEYRMKLPAGDHRLSAAFVNEFTDPKNPNPNLRARSLLIDNFELASLTDPATLPPRPAPIERMFEAAATPPVPTGMAAFFAHLSGRKPVSPTPAAQARAIVAEFAHRAWRRPVAPAEVDSLMGLYTSAAASGKSFDASVKYALEATLVSPYFLFRGEVPPAVTTLASGAVLAQPVSEIALASRLSYFLWSSTPDDELLGLAEHGLLRQNLDAQVRRMLAAPKAHALVSNFAGQWLEIRNLKFVEADKKMFPMFDDELRDDMQEETETFFDYIMRQDRSVIEFLNADYTFVNERLAKHYGISNVTGDEFRRVSLVGTPRRGVLTQASVLTVTSNPTRTSPVKRGKWVLEDLLGTPPPPPPPEVPPLPIDSHAVTGTMRQQMEQHRVNPVCASCHARMDPIGFGLENFDAIGQWRTRDGTAPVDPSGKLTSGESFNGAVELINILAEKKRDNFVRNLAEKMLTYALGRGIERYDRPAIDKIMKETAASGYRFSSLVLAVAKSVPFDKQRAETTVLAAQ
jgi:mono/diheme cytochrome c family protein